MCSSTSDSSSDYSSSSSSDYSYNSSSSHTSSSSSNSSSSSSFHDIPKDMPTCSSHSCYNDTVDDYELHEADSHSYPNIGKISSIVSNLDTIKEKHDAVKESLDTIYHNPYVPMDDRIAIFFNYYSLDNLYSDIKRALTYGREPKVDTDELILHLDDLNNRILNLRDTYGVLIDKLPKPLYKYSASDRYFDALAILTSKITMIASDLIEMKKYKKEIESYTGIKKIIFYFKIKELKNKITNIEQFIYKSKHSYLVESERWKRANQ